MLCMKFSSCPVEVCRGTSIPYFKVNAIIFCCYVYCKEYLNPQVLIAKLINEHSVDYHPNPS